MLFIFAVYSICILLCTALLFGYSCCREKLKGTLLKIGDAVTMTLLVIFLLSPVAAITWWCYAHRMNLLPYDIGFVVPLMVWLISIGPFLGLLGGALYIAYGEHAYES